MSSNIKISIEKIIIIHIIAHAIKKAMFPLWEIREFLLWYCKPLACCSSLWVFVHSLLLRPVSVFGGFQDLKIGELQHSCGYRSQMPGLNTSVEAQICKLIKKKHSGPLFSPSLYRRMTVQSRSTSASVWIIIFSLLFLSEHTVQNTELC